MSSSSVSKAIVRISGQVKTIPRHAYAVLLINSAVNRLKEERKQHECKEALAAQREREDRDRVERREREDREAQEKRTLAELEAECECTRRAVELEAAEKLAVLEKVRREAEALRKKNEHLLRTLHPINEKEDLEVYLTGMEHILLQYQVNEGEWLFYLTANMSGRYAALARGLTIDDDEEYEAVKGRLLEAAGLTTMVPVSSCSSWTVRILGPGGVPASDTPD